MTILLLAIAFALGYIIGACRQYRMGICDEARRNERLTISTMNTTLSGR